MSLLWRVFLTNAAVLAGATTALAVSPATVSFPLAAAEAVVLAVGLCAMLVIDFVVLRRVFEPLATLTRFTQEVDPLNPTGRVSIPGADHQVAELAEAVSEMIDRLATERRESARRALAAQEAESQRIARELHDQVGQALTAIMLRLEQVTRAEEGSTRDEVAAAREDLREALDDVREIAKRLRPEALDDLGLTAALSALTNAISRRTGVRIIRSVDSRLPRFSSDEELVLYRVAQEALTNVVRHSGAAEAELVLLTRSDRAELVVRDRGSGFDPAAVRDGAGIRGMRERALLVNAELEVDSEIDEGTEVRLRLA
jgi:two-component system sensor histidine kinase UhpB